MWQITVHASVMINRSVGLWDRQINATRMRKLLLFLSLLSGWLIAAAQVSEETWVSIGIGSWIDPFWTSDGKPCTGQVEIEQSIENPGDYRFKPFEDEDFIRVNAGDKDRVYISAYTFKGSNGIKVTVAQRCLESCNSTDNLYGTLEARQIRIPGDYFLNSKNGGTLCEKNRVFILRFPINFNPITYAEWSYIGKGQWQDPVLTLDGSHVFSDVSFEKSNNTIGIYRCTLQSWPIDKIKIHIVDSEKVFIEPYSYFADSGVIPTIVQKCKENHNVSDEQNSCYGQLRSGKNFLPSTSFLVSLDGNSHEISEVVDNPESCVISLPKGFMLPNQESGIYLGLISFNEGLREKPISILDDNSKLDFISFVNEMEMKDATYLYYAVEKSLDHLEKTIFPSDLKKAILITFTDGLDQGSSNIAGREDITPEEYANELHERINKTIVGGKIPLESYSIGLKGDSESPNFFDFNLLSFASNAANKIDIENIDGLQQSLFKISDELNEELSQSNLSFSRPSMYNTYKYRYTLDGARKNNGKTEIWFEGVYNSKEKSLEDVSYHGFTCTNGSTIKMTENGNRFQFTLYDCRDYNGNILAVDSEDIDEWFYVAMDEKWNPNTESKNNSKIQNDIIKSSAVVVFAMDASDSLGEDFPLVKSTAESFIRRLAGESGTVSILPVSNMKDDFEIDINDPELEIYTLQGIRVKEPTQGLHICRKGGMVKKVMF